VNSDLKAICKCAYFMA